MGQNSAIEWTTHTFNPWIGCTKVSAGCAHCYAETLMDHRYGKAKWGPSGTRVRTSEANWRQPIKWNADAKWMREMYARHDEIKEPYQRPRVFCASLADVFEDRPELDPWRRDLFNLIYACRELDWLLLTKRPEKAFDWIGGESGAGWSGWPEQWPHVWLGTSVENQEAANQRIPRLLKCPVAVRFLSMEPLLGPVDLAEAHPGFPYLGSMTCEQLEDNEIHWVIVGGESGHGSRPMHPEWARSIRDQCNAACVQFFFKQWGEYEPVTPLYDGRDDSAENGRGDLAQVDTAGHIWTDRDGQPNDLGTWLMERVGKKAAGRLLDGKEWSEFPVVL